MDDKAKALYEAVVSRHINVRKHLPAGKEILFLAHVGGTKYEIRGVGRLSGGVMLFEGGDDETGTFIILASPECCACQIRVISRVPEQPPKPAIGFKGLMD